MLIIFYEKLREEQPSLIYHEGDNSFPPHFHKNIELLYCLESGLDVFVNGNKITLSKNELLILDSYEVHYIIGKQNSLSLVIPLIYTDDYFKYKGGKSLCKNLLVDAGGLYAKLIREVWNKKEAGFLLMKGLVNTLLGNIVIEAGLKTDKPGKSGALIRKIIIYINENFQNNITLSELAAKFSYNKFVISHTFNNEVGMNLNEYINTLRLDNFIETMKDNKEAEETQVIFDSGFNSLQTFYRAFSKKFGVSPNRYLKEFL